MNNKELYEDYLKSVQHPWITHVENVYEKYVNIWNRTRVERSGANEDQMLYEYCDYEEIGDDYVLFKGEEYWQYGGYESHRITIPLKYFLCDSGDLLREFEIERSGRKSAILTKQEHEAKKRKREEFERLKKELGEE